MSEEQAQWGSECTTESTNGNNSLFHYTDATALMSIIENKQLWLTHIKYLNDCSEFIEGEAIAIDEMDKLNKSLGYNIESLTNSLKTNDDFYVASFCQSATDKLSQWRGYCPASGGYAIEFNREFIENNSQFFNKCIYTKSEKKQVAKDQVEKLLKAFEHILTGQPEVKNNPRYDK